MASAAIIESENIIESYKRAIISISSGYWRTQMREVTAEAAGRCGAAMLRLSITNLFLCHYHSALLSACLRGQLA